MREGGALDDVAALVVAFDSAHALPDCLAALAREGVPALVVDNASTDGSADLAERLGARVLRLPRNEGFGRAMNRGAAVAGASHLLLLNPDAVLDPGATDALMGAAARYPDAGLLAPRLVEPSGRVFFQPRSLLSPYLPNPCGRLALPEGDACAPFLSGAALLVPRDLFLALGGFDERLFLFYEDDDLCRRVADAGRALVHVHDAVVRHGRGRSTAPTRGRALTARWHQAWSRAYVSAKWGLPSPARGMVLANLPKALGALAVGRRDLAERYGGSALGALAWLRGQDALAREGLAGGDAGPEASPAASTSPAGGSL